MPEHVGFEYAAGGAAVIAGIQESEFGSQKEAWRVAAFFEF